MERTNRKFFGFAALAIIAVTVALMFSIFAHAVKADEQFEPAAQPATIAKLDQANDTKNVTINAADKDPFGNKSVVYVVNDSTEEIKTSVDLELEDGNICALYCFKDSVYDTYTATFYVWENDTQLTSFINDKKLLPETSTNYKYKVKCVRDEGSYANLQNFVRIYDKNLETTFLDSAVISDYEKLPDITLTIDTTSLPDSLNVSTENVLNQVTFLNWGFDVSVFGEALAVWVEETPFGRDIPVSPQSNFHTGANVAIDTENFKVYITDYLSDTRELITHTYKLSLVSPRVNQEALFAFKTIERIPYDNEFELLADSTICSAVSIQAYSVDGVQYKIMSFDKIKGWIDDMASITSNPFLVYISKAVDSLPSTFAAVSGLDDDHSENLVIPNTVVSPYEGIEFQVSAVLPDALSSDTIKNITFPFTMKTLWHDSCTGLTNLETVTFEDTGIAYIPNFNYFLTKEGHDFTINLSYITFQIINAPDPVARMEWKALFDGLIDWYIDSKVSTESAFDFTMLASFQGLMSHDIDPVVCNDNPYFKLDNNLEGLNVDASNIHRVNLRGTFKVCPELKKAMGRKVMFGTGTFSSIVLDKVTQSPVVNAKITFNDEFGKTHIAYTDSRGVFTIDDLMQTVAFLRAKFLPFKDRSFVIEANDYKTTTIKEGTDEFNSFFESLSSDNEGNDVDNKWPKNIGCYTYYNPVQTSNVVFEHGFPMQRARVSCYIESAANLNYVADVAAGSTLSGANVQIYELNESGAQKFVFEPEINKEGHLVSLSIRNAQSGKYLDVTGGVAANYVNVQQYDGNGTDAQKWIPEIDGEFVILHSAVNYDYVLDLNSGNAINCQNLQIFQANGSDAQKFHLLDVVPSVPAGDTDLADGTYVIRTGVNPETVLDVQWGSTDDGADVWAYQYAKGNTNQMWQVTQVAWGYYTIKNAHTGKYLDVAGCGIVPGTNVWQYSGNDTAAQLWSISKVTENGATFYKLVNVGTGLTLDVAGASTTSGANVQGYIDNGTAAQQFVFEPMVK